jgi:uncharacterized membrane protein
VRFSREGSEFDRVIGFFDATFAVALTLLVTTLDVTGDRSVWESLGSLEDAVGSHFIAFAIAFVLIANYWLVHRRLIASLDALDTHVLVANLFLIAAVVLLPFTTDAVGDPKIDDLALPTAVFAIDVAAASMALTIIYWLAWKRNLFRLRPSRPELRANLIASAIPAAVFIVSVPIAYAASPIAAKLSWLSLLILGRLGHATRSDPEPADA